MARFTIRQTLLFIVVCAVIFACCRTPDGAFLLILVAGMLPGFILGRRRGTVGIVWGILSSGLILGGTGLAYDLYDYLSIPSGFRFGELGPGPLLSAFLFHFILGSITGAFFASLLALVVKSLSPIWMVDKGPLLEVAGEPVVGRSSERRHSVVRRWLPGVTVLTSLVIIATLIYLHFVPPDRIKVAANNLPTGIYFLCFVTQRDGKIVTMDWSPHGMLSPPIIMDPERCNWSYQSFPKTPKVDWNAWVRWQFAKKYGILAHMEDESWHVFWYDEKQIPLQGRQFLFGGGLAEFDGSKAESEAIVTEGEIQSLGLSGVRRSERRDLK